MLSSLLVGLIFGFIGSMPIAGPIAAIVVSHGLERRARTGLFIAVGSAVAETIYAFMAFWGLTAMVSRFPVLLPISRLVGCAVLAALGVYFVARPAKRRKPPRRERSPKGPRSLLVGFSVTIANPTLIVSWTAVVGVAHSTGLLRVDARDALPFAGGVGAGIIGWFVVLLWLLERFRERVSAATLGHVIRGMGVALIVCGVGLGVRVITKL
jgi:threonine/homoserine/homoserine lactone efflux protein